MGNLFILFLDMTAFLNKLDNNNGLCFYYMKNALYINTWQFVIYFPH